MDLDSRLLTPENHKPESCSHVSPNTANLDFVVVQSKAHETIINLYICMEGACNAVKNVADRHYCKRYKWCGRVPKEEAWLCKAVVDVG